MKVVAPYDREALRAQFRSATPFPWIKLDGFLQPDFADEVAASYPPFEQALELGRQFTAVNEHKKVQIVDYARFPTAVKQLSDAVSSPDFLADLEYITGMPKLLWDPEFSGGGMHETANSGWLDVHIDFNVHEKLQAHRRLNILVFLNPEWDERWGGVFELWDVGVQTRMQALAPVHNRCVVFETSERSWHGVTPVSCPQGIARKSFAAYYYTREAPADWDGTAHSTVFKPRPDEYWKRHVAMPAESAARTLQRGVHEAKQIVKKLIRS
jgi:hypothetical protein